MHLIATAVAAYLVMCWLDGRSIRRNERRRRRQVHAELADLERQERERGEPWIDI